jgi:hypothetical protein
MKEKRCLLLRKRRTYVLTPPPLYRRERGRKKRIKALE